MAVSRTLYIVIREDRHTDDEITAHETREGADAAVEKFKARYDGERWKKEHWRDPKVLCYFDAGDDGPKVRIEIAELEP